RAAKIVRVGFAPLRPLSGGEGDIGDRRSVHAVARKRGEKGAAAPLAVFIASFLMIASMPAMAKTPVILDFGDSLTAGFGLPAAQAFPARLEAWLHDRGTASRVVNA